MDTIATIYINDQLIGKTDNQFVRYVFDVKNKLRTDQNFIKVAFESAPLYSQNKAKDYTNKYHYTPVPGLNFYEKLTLIFFYNCRM